MSVAVIGGLAAAIGAAYLAMGYDPKRGEAVLAGLNGGAGDPNLPPSVNGSQADTSGAGFTTGTLDPNAPPSSQSPAAGVGATDQLAPGTSGGGCTTCGGGYKAGHTAQAGGAAATVGAVTGAAQSHGGAPAFKPAAGMSRLDQTRQLRAMGPTLGIVF